MSKIAIQLDILVEVQFYCEPRDSSNIRCPEYQIATNFRYSVYFFPFNIFISFLGTMDSDLSRQVLARLPGILKLKLELMSDLDGPGRQVL